MGNDFERFAARTKAQWSDEARSDYVEASVEFAVEVAERARPRDGASS